MLKPRKGAQTNVLKLVVPGNTGHERSRGLRPRLSPQLQEHNHGVRFHRFIHRAAEKAQDCLLPGVEPRSIGGIEDASRKL